MNKIIKIVGVWAAAELIIALGKGHMLANVRRFYPEAGEGIRGRLEAARHDEYNTISNRLSCAIICGADDLMTNLYNDKDQKYEERG